MDLENERAGREVGRIERFLSPEASPAEIKKRRERDQERLSALIALLRTSPEYARLHKGTMEKLRRHELAAEIALQDAIARGDQTEVDAIRRYQVDVLGRARDRLLDEDDPPTKEEIEQVQDAIENAPPTVRQALPDPAETPSLTKQSSLLDVKLPPIGG